MVEQYGQRKAHLGSAGWASEGDVYEAFQDDTLKADDPAFFLKIRCSV